MILKTVYLILIFFYWSYKVILLFNLYSFSIFCYFLRNRKGEIEVDKMKGLDTKKKGVINVGQWTV